MWVRSSKSPLSSLSCLGETWSGNPGSLVIPFVGEYPASRGLHAAVFAGESALTSFSKTLVLFLASAFGSVLFWSWAGSELVFQSLILLREERWVSFILDNVHLGPNPPWTQPLVSCSSFWWNWWALWFVFKVSSRIVSSLLLSSFEEWLLLSLFRFGTWDPAPLGGTFQDYCSSR